MLRSILVLDSCHVKLLVLIQIAIASLSCASVTSSPGLDCPQPRFTSEAPPSIYNTINLLIRNEINLGAGRILYEEETDPACHICHGIAGDGMGPLALQYDPPPRNFSCAEMVNSIVDGQLFWVVQNGSPGTNMQSYGYLSDKEIWQLVMYIREFAQ